MPHMLGIAPGTVRLLPQVFTAKGVCHPHVFAQCGLLAGLEFVAGGKKNMVDYFCGLELYHHSQSIVHMYR